MDNKRMNMIGEQIKKARTKANLSQKELSDALEELGVSTCRCSVSRIESGKRAVTDMEVDAISKVLNVSLNYLFNRE
ncbi:MAG: helix-turn-helix transcriptional regulator [Ruminococcaceae bacterium]|nr:helix-turn-helix transcriptional regulator [Oscillospiraceae bacterium]